MLKAWLLSLYKKTNDIRVNYNCIFIALILFFLFSFYLVQYKREEIVNLFLNHPIYIYALLIYFLQLFLLGLLELFHPIALNMHLANLTSKKTKTLILTINRLLNSIYTNFCSYYLFVPTFLHVLFIVNCFYLSADSLLYATTFRYFSAIMHDFDFVTPLFLF